MSSSFSESQLEELIRQRKWDRLQMLLNATSSTSGATSASASSQPAAPKPTISSRQSAGRSSFRPTVSVGSAPVRSQGPIASSQPLTQPQLRIAPEKLPELVNLASENGAPKEVIDSFLAQMLSQLNIEEASKAFIGTARSGKSRLLASTIYQTGGLSVNAKDSEGNTAIHMAVRSSESSEDYVQALLEQSAGIDDPNKNGFTPLHYAVRRSPPSPRIVKILLEKGARVNVSNEERLSVLHLAATCFHASMEVIELLLSNHADVNARDNYLRTPADLAEQWGNHHLLPLLRSTIAASTSQTSASASSSTTGTTTAATNVLSGGSVTFEMSQEERDARLRVNSCFPRQPIQSEIPQTSSSLEVAMDALAQDEWLKNVYGFVYNQQDPMARAISRMVCLQGNGAISLLNRLLQKESRLEFITANKEFPAIKHFQLRVRFSRRTRDSFFVLNSMNETEIADQSWEEIYNYLKSKDVPLTAPSRGATADKRRRIRMADQVPPGSRESVLTVFTVIVPTKAFEFVFQLNTPEIIASKAFMRIDAFEGEVNNRPEILFADPLQLYLRVVMTDNSQVTHQTERDSVAKAVRKGTELATRSTLFDSMPFRKEWDDEYWMETNCQVIVIPSPDQRLASDTPMLESFDSTPVNLFMFFSKHAARVCASTRSEMDEPIAKKLICQGLIPLLEAERHLQDTSSEFESNWTSLIRECRRKSVDEAWSTFTMRDDTIFIKSSSDEAPLVELCRMMNFHQRWVKWTVHVYEQRMSSLLTEMLQNKVHFRVNLGIGMQDAQELSLRVRRALVTGMREPPQVLSSVNVAQGSRSNTWKRLYSLMDAAWGVDPEMSFLHDDGDTRDY